MGIRTTTVRLTREIEEPGCCRGLLEVFDAAGAVVAKMFTIEKPWIPHDSGKAGTPFRSCVPPGTYSLLPYTRPSGEEVWALNNPSLDVYTLDTDIPPERRGIARYLILIHAGNYARDVVGCIAPGTGWRRTPDGTPLVMRSPAAMKQLHEALDGKRRVELQIRSTR